MPWAPELFSAPTLAAIQERRHREHLSSVPLFDGLLTGEMNALIGSFAAEPELHHPVRGRIRGERAFERYVIDTKAWFTEHRITVEDVELFQAARRGVEEVILHLDAAGGRIALPLAGTADKDQEGRIIEMRLYYTGWPLNGHHTVRQPVLQPDPDLVAADVVGEFRRALMTGDVDAAVAQLEPDGYVREPAGRDYVHRGSAQLRALFEWFFSNGGGIAHEHCSVIDDGRACAIEYNVVRWGETVLPPQGGVVVHVRGQSGKLAAVRIYDDVERPLG